MASDQPTGDVTRLLEQARQGGEQAQEELYSLVWGELHRIARAHMQRRGPDHTLQPTALVNEAWMRLAPPEESGWRDREHFLSFASRVMRSVLVDHARRRAAGKRGGGDDAVSLDAVGDRTLCQAGNSEVDLIALDDALEILQEEDAELARIVDLRFFGGLSMEEVASAAEISLSTAERRWRLARIWLRDHLDGFETDTGESS